MTYLDLPTLQDLASATTRRVCGGDPSGVVTMPGGASVRRYHRVMVAGGRPASLLIMELGANPLQSEEAAKQGKPAELPFLDVQRYLARAGVSVPEVYHYDEPHGLVYLEDLGDVTFESRVLADDESPRRHYYQLAIDQLVTLQRYAAAHPDPACVAFQRGFDYELLKWELDHFREYGLEAQGLMLAPAEREEVERHFRRIAEELAASPRGFVHRDYQSRNLMVQDGDRLRVIDFQDALQGSAAYDLVGLLRDSYVALAPSLVEELVDYYVGRAGVGGDFGRLFDLQTVQRKLKDAGRFVFIDRVKHNPSFLVHIPSSLVYVRRALGRLPELAPLQEILGRHLPALQA
jgi:aminoglycoside/choline kinase family phosphotransferase